MVKNQKVADVYEVIRSRRTCKKFNGSPIAKSTIEEFLDLAILAPNHRLNQPWKFRVLSQSGIQKLISHFQSKASPDDLKAFEKNFEKLKSAGAVIYITCAQDSDMTISKENFAATSAAIQNILLSATASEIQSYWGTGKFATHPINLEYLRIDSSENFVGWIWLGYGEVKDAPARIAASEKTIWFD